MTVKKSISFYVLKKYPIIKAVCAIGYLILWSKQNLQD